MLIWETRQGTITLLIGLTTMGTMNRVTADGQHKNNKHRTQEETVSFFIMGKRGQ